MISPYIAVNFNPREPCGPRPWTFLLITFFSNISILAVLADRDPGKGQHSAYRQNFNPRGPCGPRRFRPKGLLRLTYAFQSSRSLRTATFPACGRAQCKSYFNPRGPCGPRPCCPYGPDTARTFQSSRSLRTATRPPLSQNKQQKHFNPRGPCGPRHFGYLLYWLMSVFQSSRSLRTSTQGAVQSGGRPAISILAVLADRDSNDFLQ